MENDLEKLIQILCRLVGLHQKLFELVKEEKKCLEDADIKSIHQITCGKEIIIHTIRQEEITRQKIVAALAASLKISVHELSLRKIIELIQVKQTQTTEKLSNLYQTLNFLIERISAQNNENKKLIETSLEHVSVMKNNILGKNTESLQTYTATGKQVSTTIGSKLISKEAY